MIIVVVHMGDKKVCWVGNLHDLYDYDCWWHLRDAISISAKDEISKLKCHTQKICQKGSSKSCQPHFTP